MYKNESEFEHLWQHEDREKPEELSFTDQEKQLDEIRILLDGLASKDLSVYSIASVLLDAQPPLVDKESNGLLNDVEKYRVKSKDVYEFVRLLSDSIEHNLSFTEDKNNYLNRLKIILENLNN